MEADMRVLSVEESKTIYQAKRILADRVASGTLIKQPSDVFDYLIVALSEEPREHFGVVTLTNKHRVISNRILHSGTINSCSVHPREVAKQALSDNAAAVILYHNHPSGTPDISQADVTITGRVKDTLALLDVRTLDSVIVAGGQCVSLAQAGEL